MKFKIDRRSFVKSMERLAFCSYEPSRWKREQNKNKPFPQEGALFEFDPNSDKITGVATDGHRMAIVGMNTSADHPMSWKLPKRTMTDFRNFSNKSKSLHVELEVQDNWFNLSDQSCSIGAPRLEDEDFPSWRRVSKHPRERDRLTIKTDKKNLVRVLNDVSHPYIILNLGRDTGFLTIIHSGGDYSQDYDGIGEVVGAAQAYAECGLDVKTEIHIGVNASYLRQAIIKMSGEISIITEGLSPSENAETALYFCPLFITDGDWEYILMPIRLS